ncbi:MAG: DUF998 domain-containing protein [Ignavibacteriales bacterium]|nr:DUF998 domain-containing protein [Ignavibacteriales bacterium]
MQGNDSTLTSRFLSAGIAAGPFFVVVALLQAFTREGFDYVRHPASLLSLGDGGWIQIANFVLTGFLFILCGIGLGKVLTEGIGRIWASRLFIVYGVALIMGGVFTADPGLGFPPGAPEGAAKEMSWHGTLHAFAPILGFFSQVAALIILARRFGSQGQRTWKLVTIIAAVAMFVLATIPNFTAEWEKGVFNFLPLWTSVVFGYSWTSLVISKVRKEIGSQIQ